MDWASFLKTVPAVIGIAGLLTYFTRDRKPASDLELVNYVQNVRTTFVLLGCAALIILSLWLFFRPEPPDRDAGLSPVRSPVASLSGLCKITDTVSCTVRKSSRCRTGWYQNSLNTGGLA